GQNPQANDNNLGTAAAPVKTLTKATQLALANNKLNIATRVIIQPGVYRESLQLFSTSSDTAAPISFEAAKKGTVIIDGADVWTGWQAEPSLTNTYSHAWTTDWGVEPTPSGWPTTPQIVRRREMLFVNGKLLKQVLSIDELIDD